MCNTDHGPWNGSKYWEEMKDAAKEYCKLTDRRCVHFRNHLPNMQREAADDLELLSAEAGEKLLFDSLQEIVSKKTEKVASTRWFQIVHAFGSLAKQWSRRLLLVSYLCLQLGLMTDQRCSDLITMKLGQRSEDHDVDTEKETTGNDREQVRRIRS